MRAQRRRRRRVAGTRWRSVLTSVMAVVLAGAGAGACRSGSASGSSGPVKVTAPARLPAGFDVVRDPSSGFSVAVPTRWVRVPVDEAGLKKLAELSQAKDAKAAAALRQGATVVGQGGKLFAYSPDDGGRTSVSLLVRPSPGAGVDDVATRVLEPYRQKLAAGGKVTRQVVTLNGTRAVRAHFDVPVRSEPGTVVSETQYFVVHKDTAYVLSLLGNGAELDTIGQSFTVS